MKPEQMYQGLKDLADRLGIVVSEQKLSSESFKVKSGFCKIKGHRVMILDKQVSIRKKCEILATCLSRFPQDDIYVIPAVRAFVDGYREPVFLENLSLKAKDRDDPDPK